MATGWDGVRVESRSPLWGQAAQNRASISPISLMPPTSPERIAFPWKSEGSNSPKIKGVEMVPGLGGVSWPSLLGVYESTVT